VKGADSTYIALRNTVFSFSELLNADFAEVFDFPEGDKHGG